MTAQDLLAQLEQVGVVVSVAGDRLHVEAPPGVLTDDLRHLLAKRKPELIAALTGDQVWPPESLEAERRFGHSAARLYPFVGRRVSTPHGPGRLMQVFPDRVVVVLAEEVERPCVFLPSELRPPGVTACLPEPRIH